MDGDPALSFTCSLDCVLDFLSGKIDPDLQGRLLGLDGPLHPANCEPVRTPCENALLAQLPELQGAYDMGNFDSWYYQADRVVTLRPIEHPPVTIPHKPNRWATC